MNSDDRIQDLEAKVAELTALVEQMTAPRSAAPALIETTAVETTAVEATAVESSEVEAPRTASRRGMLKLAGAAAAGAVAATASQVMPAAAADGNPILIASQTDTTAANRNTTEVVYTNTATPQVPGLFFGTFANANIFVVRDETSGFIFGDSSSSSFPAAIGGYSYRTVANGLYGYTAMGGAGVVGFGAGAGSTGLFAQGVRSNIEMKAAGAAPAARADAHVLGEVVCDSAGDVWVCTVAGTPGTWRKVAGAATSGSLHLLAAPKRVYDSRADLLPDTAPKSPLSGATRTIDCTLNSSGVPATATGLVLNLTAIAISATGYLSVSPGTTGFSGTSTLNWGSAGAVVANSATVSTGSAGGARVDVTAGGGGNANFIVDVFGYYL